MKALKSQLAKVLLADPVSRAQLLKGPSNGEPFVITDSRGQRYTVRAVPKAH